MQEVAPRFRVEELTEANRKLKEMRDLDPTIKVPKLTANIYAADVWTFSDAYFNIVTGPE